MHRCNPNPAGAENAMSTETPESSDGLELLDDTQSSDPQLTNDDAPVHVIIDRSKDEVRIRMRYPVAVFGAIGLVFLMLFSLTSLVWIVCRKPTVITVERTPTPRSEERRVGKECRSRW